MTKFIFEPRQILNGPLGPIPSFVDGDANISTETVDSFGDEWNCFSDFQDKELSEIGSDYFDLLPCNLIEGSSVALDVGCGSGRWTKLIAPKFRFIEAIDPSSSVFVAQKNCSGLSNVRVSRASVANLPFPEESFDLVFSLGVLHHIPDTAAGIKSCVKMIKPAGYFLVYLYYSLDNRGWLFKLMFQIVNSVRRIVSQFPFWLKHLICDLIAVVVYLPLAGLARITEKIAGSKVAEKLPLNYYRNTRFHIMRNDSRDRFGTPLEKRFSRDQICSMLEEAGLVDIRFSQKQPFWVAIGQKPIR